MSSNVQDVLPLDVVTSTLHTRRQKHHDISTSYASTCAFLVEVPLTRRFPLHGGKPSLSTPFKQTEKSL